MSTRPHIACERLAEVTFAYLGFDGVTHHDGAIVVMDVLARDVEAVFDALLRRRFPIRQARPIEAYEGDDDASIAADNTSAYNDRGVLGTGSVSVHAYGAAIDLNPLENPYVTRLHGKIDVAPPAGRAFVDRNARRPGMAEAVIGVFARHGFTVWGGRWASAKDYQHFQVDRPLAARLAGGDAETAAALWRRIRSTAPRVQKTGLIK